MIRRARKVSGQVSSGYFYPIHDDLVTQSQTLLLTFSHMLLLFYQTADPTLKHFRSIQYVDGGKLVAYSGKWSKV